MGGRQKGIPGRDAPVPLNRPSLRFGRAELRADAHSGARAVEPVLREGPEDPLLDALDIRRSAVAVLRRHHEAPRIQVARLGIHAGA